MFFNKSNVSSFHPETSVGTLPFHAIQQKVGGGGCGCGLPSKKGVSAGGQCECGKKILPGVKLSFKAGETNDFEGGDSLNLNGLNSVQKQKFCQAANLLRQKNMQTQCMQRRSPITRSMTRCMTQMSCSSPVRKTVYSSPCRIKKTVVKNSPTCALQRSPCYVKKSPCYKKRSPPRSICNLKSNSCNFIPTMSCGLTCSNLTENQKIIAANANAGVPGQYTLFQKSITCKQKQMMKESPTFLNENNKYVKDVGVLWSTAKNCV